MNLRRLSIFLSSIIIWSLPSLQAQNLNEGLVAYYPFNGNANDASGNGNHLTAQGSPEYIEGVRGNAIRFDGIDDLVLTERLISGNGFTWTGWFKVLSETGTGLMSQANASIRISPSLIHDMDRIYFYTYTNTGHVVEHLDDVSSSAWRSISVVVSENGSKKLYINGELKAENSSAAGFGELNDFFVMGADYRAPRTYQNFQADEVRIYDRALSEEEVSTLYDLEKPEPTPATGSTFQIVEGNSTWEQARADAEARGGRLAVLDSPETIAAATRLIESETESSAFLIGGYHEGGQLRWLNGELVDVDTNAWKPGDPQDEAYLVIWADGLLGDASPSDLAGHPDRYVGYILELPASTLTDGLVAYYPFNGNANDESGNGHEGTVNGAILTADRNGVTGSAYSFDGDDFIQSSAILSPYNLGTFSAWVSTSTSDPLPRGIVSQPRGESGTGFVLSLQGNGQPRGDFLDPPAQVAAVPEGADISDSSWYHLLVTNDGQRVRLFIDGEPAAVSPAYNSDSPVSVEEILIGKELPEDSILNANGERFFIGNIDDVRIYNRALSEQEVSALYELEKPEEADWSQSTFEIVEGNFTWEEARADAEARGGRLAVLDTPAQETAAYSYLNNVGTWPFLWLGASDAEVEDTWVWLNGEPLEASNPRWKGEEGPTNNNNNPDAEDFLVMFSSGSGTNAGLWGDGVDRQAYLLETGSAPTLNTGLVAYYPFNGNANDESGNGNDGTVNGATLTSDRFEQPDRAYYFDGSGGRGIDFGDVLDINDGEFTISVWVKASDASERVIIGKGNSGLTRPAESGYMILVNDSGRYSLRYYDDQAQGVETGDPTNLQASESWDHLVYHLARQGNDTTLTLFVNGEQVGTRTGSVGSSNSEAGLSLGYHNKNAEPSYPFLGKIDDLRIYDRALSEQEVSALYDLENTPSTYTLEIATTGNGAVTGAGTYEAGTEASLTASPALGYLFAGWSDDASGNTNPLSLLMDGNRTVGASFERDTRDPDGDLLDNYEELVLHGTDPNDADSDGDGFDDGEEVAESSDPNSSGNFPTRVLVVLDQNHGSIRGAETYPLGAVVNVEARPDLGYLFRAWTGNASGTDNPRSLVMDRDRTVGAVFTEDQRDPDEDGLSNYEELVLHGTDPDFEDTDRDGLRDGREVRDLGTDPLLTDTDGDGFDDYYELRNRFDPTTAESTPESVATVFPAGEFQFIEFRFNTARGVLYKVESSLDLINWTTEETGVTGRGGPVYRFFSTESRPKAFFRARRE